MDTKPITMQRQQLLELIPIPSFLIDKVNFNIIFFNNKALKLTQSNNNALSLRNFKDFVDSKFLKPGEMKNVYFKLSSQENILGNLSLKSYDDELYIVSFLENSSISNPIKTALKNDFKNTKALIDQATDSIFIIKNGIIKYVNPNLLKVSGYTSSELLETHFSQFVLPDDLKKVQQIHSSRSKNKTTPHKYESKALLSNGSYTDVEVSISKIIYSGEPAFQVNLRDITKQKIAESKYQHIIDFAPIGFYQTARNGDFLFVNLEMAHMLGFEHTQDLISQNISDFYYSSEEREKLIKQYDTSIKHSVKNIEIKFKRKDGSPIWILMTSTAIKDENFNTLSYDGFIVDISQRKRKESEQNLLLNLSKNSYLDISLKDFLQLIYSELKNIIKSDNFYVALYDRNKKEYMLPCCEKTPKKRELTQAHLALCNSVRESKKSLLITRSNREKIFGNKIKNYNELPASWLGVPIIVSSKKEGVGVLAIQDNHDENRFNHEDLNTLEIIASNAGLFVERIKNQEKLKLAKIAAEDGEKRYKSLFYDNSSIMILIDPQTGNVVDANKSACKYYGYSYKKITSLKIHDINISSVATVKDEMNLVLKGKKQNFNFKHKLADATIRDVEVYSGKVNILGTDLLYSTIYDVTEQSIAKKNIVKLSTSIEQSPISILITDLKGKIEYINPYYSEITGYDRNELIGKNAKILKSGKQDQSFYKKLWDTILSGNKWQGEMCNKKKNGELFWEKAIISPIKNSTGTITNFVGIKEDISERKIMIDELIHAKERAEESDRLKSAFLSNMSHEIRTPMNGILGFTHLLKRSDLDNNTKENYIQIIHQSGQRMLNTVNDIIEISKIETGIVEVKNSEFNLNESINDIIDFFKPQSEQKNLQLYFDHQSRKSEYMIYTDKSKFESILTNLIKNAIKFSNKGTITIGYRDKDTAIEFYVKDEGIGISQSRQNAIFNRFVQEDISDTKVFEGSGLGLAISKSYVEMIGGMIGVKSKLDSGSTFYFTLPHFSK